jgi:hypothetical protein
MKKKAVGRRQEAEVVQEKRTASCLLPTAYSPVRL